MSNISTKALENRKFWVNFMNCDIDDMTDWQWVQAYQHARSWDTCACGSINDGLPRIDIEIGDWEPTDNKLYTSGIRFMGFIRDHELNEARTCFNDIQKRAGIVLRKKFKTI